MDPIIIKCPSTRLIINKNEINCAIFRHGILIDLLENKLILMKIKKNVIY